MIIKAILGAQDVLEPLQNVLLCIRMTQSGTNLLHLILNHRQVEGVQDIVMNLERGQEMHHDAGTTTTQISELGGNVLVHDLGPVLLQHIAAANQWNLING